MIEVCKHVVFVAFMQTVEHIQNEFSIIVKQIYAHLRRPNQGQSGHAEQVCQFLSSYSVD